MSCWHYSAAANKLVMAHPVESGELALDDVKEAENALRKFPGKDEQP